MIRSVDTDEILTELQALAQDSTGPATVAILACMDVVDRHAKIVDEHEIAARLQVEPVPSLIVQQGFPVKVDKQWETDEGVMVQGTVPTEVADKLRATRVREWSQDDVERLAEGLR